jgi:uncharacterized protein (TIGR01777 family)
MTNDRSNPRSIAITGASGLVGSALAASLREQGRRVVSLVRGEATEADTIRWSPHAGLIEPEALDGVDTVVHLAGESIAEGRWTPEKKQRIRESRVEGTRALAQSLAGLPSPPEALLCASAIGYYGHRGDAVLDESSAAGQGFLPEVCLEWEDAAGPAAEAGIRVAHLRIGIVLSERGGALAKMLLPFKLGAGGVLGRGNQWMSWISLEDLVRVFESVVENPDLEGPINCVAPSPVTNREFTKTLGRALGRPTFLPAPEFALRLGLGEMADALLLASTRVVPDRLQEHGFAFSHPDLDSALRSILKRN